MLVRWLHVIHGRMPIPYTTDRMPYMDMELYHQTLSFRYDYLDTQFYGLLQRIMQTKELDGH